MQKQFSQIFLRVAHLKSAVHSPQPLLFLWGKDLMIQTIEKSQNKQVASKAHKLYSMSNEYEPICTRFYLIKQCLIN